MYRPTDSSVTVDSTGLVTARYFTHQTMVIASMQDPDELVTNVDTAWIQVDSTSSTSIDGIFLKSYYDPFAFNGPYRISGIGIYTNKTYDDTLVNNSRFKSVNRIQVVFQVVKRTIGRYRPLERANGPT